MPVVLGGGGHVPLITQLGRLGQTSNLKLTQDLGDSNCYPGSGQTVTDTSGTGTHFNLGADNSATSTDPTFNGVAGGLSASEYLGFDGGDYLRLAASNPAWINNLHKDNALFTLMMWVRLGASGTNRGLFGTYGGLATNIGVGWYVSSANLLTFQAHNGSGTPAYNQTSSNSIADSTWLCLGLSVNEAQAVAGVTYFQNGAVDTDAGAYNSPSASDATYTAEIAARGNANAPVPNLTRVAMFMAWEGRALPAAAMDAVFQTTRGRFGV